MLPVLKYTVFRLAIFGVVLVALVALGARRELALALAVIVSMLVSYLLLRRQRDAVTDVVIRRLAGRGTRPAGADEQVEDAGATPGGRSADGQPERQQG